jgi:PAS domain S-box-containing protein
MGAHRLPDLRARHGRSVCGLIVERYVVAMQNDPAGEKGDQRALAADRTGVIRRWNTECQTVFGYTSDEAVGHKLDLIVPPALQARHWRGFNRAMETGQLRRPGRTFKLPAIHKSGAIISVHLIGATLTKAPDGTVSGAMLTPHQGTGWERALWRPVLGLLNIGRRRRRSR